MMKVNFSQKLIQYSVLITLFTGLVGCSTPSANAPSETPAPSPQASPINTQTTQPQELKTVKVTLSWLLQGVDAPLILAIEKGYFKEAGINVVWERGFGNGDAVTKLGAGQYDIGFSDVYNMMEFNEKNPTQKMTAVAMVFNKAPFSIVSLKNSKIDTPQQLAGKTIGAPAGDGPRRLWPVFAKEVGVDPNSVTWTSMEPKLRETFLIQNKVEAISAFATTAVPNLNKAGVKQEELNVFYYTDYGLDLYGNGILVREEFLKANPEVIKGFVRAYLKGLKDTLADPAAGLDAVKRAGDQLLDMEAEKLRLQIALERQLVNEETKKNGLGAVEPARLEKTIKQVAEGFGLSKVPAVKEVFDESFLPPKSER